MPRKAAVVRARVPVELAKAAMRAARARDEPLSRVIRAALRAYASLAAAPAPAPERVVAAAEPGVPVPLRPEARREQSEPPQKPTVSATVAEFPGPAQPPPAPPAPAVIQPARPAARGRLGRLMEM